MANKYQEYERLTGTQRPATLFGGEPPKNPVGLHPHAQVAAAADKLVTEDIPGVVAKGADLPVIRQILQGLGKLYQTPVGRGVQAVETVLPSVALSGIRAVKGEKPFGEGIAEAKERFDARQNVSFQDVAKELGESIPDGTPGKSAAQGIAGFAGDVMLSPFNAIRLGTLTQKGVLAQRFTRSGKTADEIVEMAKAADAAPEVKAMADIIVREGADALRLPGTRSNQIRGDYRRAVTLSDPLKPFAQDAPLSVQLPKALIPAEAKLAETIGKGVASVQQTNAAEAFSRIFSSRPRKVGDEDAAIFNEMNDEFERAKLYREAAAYNVRKIRQKITKTDPTDKTLFQRAMRVFDFKNKQIIERDRVARILRVREEPFMTDDLALHDEALVEAFGTADPEAIAVLQYDTRFAGKAERTVERLKKGIRMADFALEKTPGDERILAAKASLQQKLGYFTEYADQIDEIPVQRSAASIQESIDKIDEELGTIDGRMTQIIGESDRVKAEMDKMAFPSPRGPLVQRMSALEEASAATAKRREELMEMQAGLQKRLAERTEAESLAEANIEALKGVEDAQRPAVEVLQTAVGDVDVAAEKATSYLNYGERRKATMSKKAAERLSKETVAERAKRLSKGDVVKESELLEQMLTEVETRRKQGPDVRPPQPTMERKPYVPKPPKPNPSVPPTPQAATPDAPIKPAPLKPEAIKEAAELDQSVLSILRATAVNADGTVNESVYKQFMDHIKTDPAARENMAREMTWEFMRDVTPDEKMRAGLVKDFLDDLLSSEEAVGILTGHLENYIRHAHLKPGGKLRSKALKFTLRAGKKGEIPEVGHTKKRNLSESIFEYNDAMRRAGVADKAIEDDLFSILGISSREAASMVGAKRALGNIADRFGIAIDGKMSDAMDRIGPRAAMMQKMGNYSEDAIKRADIIDRRLAWREQVGGPKKVGKILQDIDTGNTEAVVPYSMKKMLAAKHRGMTLDEGVRWHSKWSQAAEDEINRVYSGMSRDELRSAGKAIETELKVAEALRDQTGPDVGMFVTRFSLDKLAAMTDDELGKLGAEAFAAVRRIAGEQEPGKYIVSLDQDLVPTFNELARQGKVDAWLFPRQVADHLNEHVHKFNDTDVGKLYEVLSPIRSFVSRSTLMPYLATHMANLAGGVYNAVVYGGAKASNFVEGMNVLRGKNMDKVYRNAFGDELTGRQILELAEKNGTMAGGFWNVQEFDELEKSWRYSQNPVKRALDLPGRAFELGENWMRFSYFLDQWQAGLDGFHATKQVNKVFHDYSDLSDVERHIRLVMPFYAFARKQPPLVLQHWAQRPYLTTLDQKIVSAMQTSTGKEPSGEERAAKPGFLREREMVYLGENDDGEAMWAPADVFLPNQPAEDLLNIIRRAGTGEGSGDAMSFVSRMVGPHVRSPAEMLSGRRFDTGADIARPEQRTPLLGVESDPRVALMVRSFRPLRTIDDAFFGVGRTEEQNKSIKQRMLALAGYTLYELNVDDELDRRERELEKYESDVDRSLDEREERGGLSDRDIQRAEEKIENKYRKFEQETQDFPR